MKIAYVCYWDARRRDGVGDKILSQLAAWRAAGETAELFLLSPPPAEGSILYLEGEVFTFSGARERVKATRRLYAAVRRYRPDAVYLRYDLFVPPPSALARHARTVVEINSNARAELGERSRAAALYERLQERAVLRRAAGAVCVTHELAESITQRSPALPVRVIANGIEFAGITPLPAPAGEGIRLVYLGDDVYWQGVDKLFELAASTPDWQYDLIGVDERRSGGNVTCHGFLPADQYEPILARADIAVGTLALYRKQMNEACALKVRRYLAYGLPVLLGHIDTDFIGREPWFLLRLPNTDSNVADGLDRIREFARTVKGRRVERSEVEPLLSAAAKEAERLAFLAELTM
jgi:hypothetical protein